MKKGIIITIGVLVASGIGYYIFTKLRKPKTDRMQGGSDSQSSSQPNINVQVSTSKPTGTTTTSSGGTVHNVNPLGVFGGSTSTTTKPSYGISYIQVDKSLAKSESPHLIALGIIGSRPKEGTIKVGDIVTITGTGLVRGSSSVDGQKRVERLFIDSSGNIGAIYVTTTFAFDFKQSMAFTYSGYNVIYKYNLTNAKFKKV